MNLIDTEFHKPDILDCISNLSADEVFTPPYVANLMLDSLPAEIWEDPSIKILDPACKTGIFLREAAKRLMSGLENKIPDEVIRRDHIFKKMLFGMPITELTGLMSRRTLYYSKIADSDLSVVKMDTPDGNLGFSRYEHQFQNARCKDCGTPYENVERGDAFENYAYQFIHRKDLSELKFDVIIGNPPYQLESSGFGAQATPIYQLFVEQAFRLKPRYVCMITPSRWFSGGMGLDGFRKRMLESKNFRKLVDYPDASEIFPNVQIKGGVSYFLWDKNYQGMCEVSNVLAGVKGEPRLRNLAEHDDVFIRFNEAVGLVNRIKEMNFSTFDELISPINPFDLPTNFADLKTKSWSGSIKVYNRGGFGYVSKKEITKGIDLLDKYKLFIPKASDGSGSFPIQVLSNPIIGAPGEACTMTYLVVGPFKSDKEARSAASFLRSKFVRFLVAMLKNTQDTSKSKFKFVPTVEMNTVWTDSDLYKLFKVTAEEQVLIESMIKEMPEQK